MRLPLVVAFVLVTTSCSENVDSHAPAPKGEPAITLVPADASVSSSAIVAGTGVDPSTLHLDDVDTHRPIPPQPLVPRERKPIDVTLRSSPPGARVSVDGTAVGITPAFWRGYADGREHEFVFTLSGHAIARYRFVPVSSGVIHARLDPILEQPDAGVTPPPEVVPRPPVSAVVPPAPPPTIVTPTVDAAVGAPPPAPVPEAAPPVPGSGPQP